MQFRIFFWKTDGIADNPGRIADKRSEIADNPGRIADKRSEIADNPSNIADNLAKSVLNQTTQEKFTSQSHFEKRRQLLVCDLEHRASLKYC
ncbi:hypothetical protein ACVWXS_000247 [Lysinibacillus sp. TE18511]